MERKNTATEDASEVAQRMFKKYVTSLSMIRDKSSRRYTLKVTFGGVNAVKGIRKLNSDKDAMDDMMTELAHIGVECFDPTAFGGSVANVESHSILIPAEEDADEFSVYAKVRFSKDLRSN